MTEVRPSAPPPGDAGDERAASASGRLIFARELLTMDGDAADRGGDGDARRVGLLREAGVWTDGRRITWVGPWAERPEASRALQAIEADVVLPAVVECHTHSLFAGSRHDEFARRNRGASYAEILEAGGGILSTVAAPRAADDAAREADLRGRLARFGRAGCALVEVKTGYALRHDEEIRQLELLARVRAADPPVAVSVTTLGAHAVPPEHRADRQAYVEEICQRTLPEVARRGLADAVDVFCDRGAFTAEEARRILGRGVALGLAARIHTDELSPSGGCAVAAEVGARSADHLEYAGPADLDRLAAADVAAVLLPGVTVFLDMERRPDVAGMRQRGIRMALSTDFNPGSSHTQDPWLMATLGCSLFKLTPGEALRGLTRVPAEILGRADRFGRIAPGCDAHLLMARLPSWRALPYHMAPLDLLEPVGSEGTAKAS